MRDQHRKTDGRINGFMPHKYGLLVGPHPDRCNCCMSVRRKHYRQIRRELDRARAKAEVQCLLREVGDHE